jgi:hypothetical protein
MYLCHLIDGEALGIPTPDEVRTAVRAALRQACDETGFTLPPQKPKPKRKKRR